MKNKFVKIIVSLSVICIAFTFGYKVCDINNKIQNEKEARLQQQFEEYEKSKTTEYVYPQGKDEEHQGISISYTSDVLLKKSKGEKLTNEEQELILEFILQSNGKGIAYTKYIEFSAGMHKDSRRIWETYDGGNQWNILREEQQYSTGYYNICYIDDVFIEASFLPIAEQGTFRLSNNGGHSFTSISFKEVYEYNGVAYPKKVDENPVKKTVTYQWVDFYSEKEIETVEYDLNLIPVMR